MSGAVSGCRSTLPSWNEPSSFEQRCKFSNFTYGYKKKYLFIIIILNSSSPCVISLSRNAILGLGRGRKFSKNYNTVDSRVTTSIC